MISLYLKALKKMPAFPSSLAGFFSLFLITAIPAIACSSPPPPIPTPTPVPTATPIPALGYCVSDYCLEGQRLEAERSPLMAWMWRDGSYWTDGESHIYPNLPLAEDEFIGPNLTCTQSEVILGISAPKEVDDKPMTWIFLPNADDLGDQWDKDFVAALYGEGTIWNHSKTARDLDAQFKIYCGDSVSPR